MNTAIDIEIKNVIKETHKAKISNSLKANYSIKFNFFSKYNLS